MALRRSLLWLARLAAVGTFAVPSRAHIDLHSPEPRAPGRPDSELSQGPCGQLDNARDPEHVSYFEPGQTIDVEWEVYVQHVSYFRVAFDRDGDDSFSGRTSLPDPATDEPTELPPNPGETILAYIEDPSGGIDHVAQRVTLPDEECDRCTLQIIQFTYGLPLRRATYYQCADIVLRRSAAGSNAPGAADAGPERPGAGAPGAASREDMGCNLPVGRPSSGALASAVLALAAGALARRARRAA